MSVRHKRKNFSWEIVNIYGPAQHHMTQEFLEELQSKCSNTSIPMVLGGDFNLIRKLDDKNSEHVNLNLMKQFNDFISENKL